MAGTTIIGPRKARRPWHFCHGPVVEKVMPTRGFELPRHDERLTLWRIRPSTVPAVFDSWRTSDPVQTTQCYSSDRGPGAVLNLLCGNHFRV